MERRDQGGVGQAEAEPGRVLAQLGAGLDEGLADALAHGLGHAAAGVPDRELDPGLGAAAPHPDRAAPRRGGSGVAQELAQGLDQVPVVRGDRQVGARRVDHERQAGLAHGLLDAACGRLEQLAGPVRGEVQRLLAAGEGRVGDHQVDFRSQALGAGLGLGQILPALGREVEVLLDQLGVAAQDGHRRAQFMRDDGEEVALQPVELLELGVLGVELAVGALERPPCVAQGDDRHQPGSGGCHVDQCGP